MGTSDGRGARRLEGRVAIVTGGARSIGLAYAEALAEEGAAVALADIVDGTKAAESIRSRFNVDAMAAETDVGDEDAVRDLVGGVIARFGRLDILVNNAALFAALPIQPLQDWTVDQWDAVMRVNVRGAFLMAKHVAPAMIARRSGKIINIGSGTANKGMPNMLPYVTSKAALLGMTRSLARELGPHGICVNTLSPGLIESPSLEEASHHLAVSDRIIASRALPRAGVPADLLGALIFLASSDSDFVTGQTLAVDGGSINT